VKPIHLFFQNLTAAERQILADGCLMNYYKNRK
jgi:aconitate hydratase